MLSLEYCKVLLLQHTNCALAQWLLIIVGEMAHCVAMLSCTLANSYPLLT